MSEIVQCPIEALDACIKEIALLKARNEKLERVREAAQDVLMIYASFGQYDPNKLIDALKDCEEAARSGE